jgi:D-glycero-D-manno-heptose 1,7-bisphosphate phosphatase
MTSPRRRAAFLDRDGTLIEDENFLADPERVRLLPGVVVVTNQSGIARGLLTEAQYEATRLRLDALLAAEGARIDRSYYCPHLPSLTGPCECRKPGTLLFRRAAAELAIDLTTSLYAGDRLRDAEPGLALGGLARLVPSPATPPEEVERARSLGILGAGLASAVDDYLALHAA